MHRIGRSACSPRPSLAPGPNCSAGSFAPPPSAMAPRCNFYEDEDLRVARNVIQASIKTQHHAARAESFQLATRALPGSCSRWSRPMQSSLSLAVGQSSALWFLAKDQRWLNRLKNPMESPDFTMLVSIASLCHRMASPFEKSWHSPGIITPRKQNNQRALRSHRWEDPSEVTPPAFRSSAHTSGGPQPPNGDELSHTYRRFERKFNNKGLVE